MLTADSCWTFRSLSLSKRRNSAFDRLRHLKYQEFLFVTNPKTEQLDRRPFGRDGTGMK